MGLFFLAAGMVKHNNIVPNVHLRKDWDRRVRTWFNQPGRKQTRRRKRNEKAAAIFPRPLQKLRPVVHCPTVRYNAKERLGRGFTLAELAGASITPTYAQTVGISVDYRRTNRSEESYRNVARLNEYKPKSTDASAAELESATQIRGTLLPIKSTKSEVERRAITDEERKKSAFQTLRVARSNRRLAGLRKKKKEDAEKK